MLLNELIKEENKLNIYWKSSLFETYNKSLIYLISNKIKQNDI